VELRGDDARLGHVPAADVAHLLLGIERALARQAAHTIGRPAADRGRWESVIANAARIRLVGLEEGSIVPVLDLPDFGVDGLALEAETLGEAALEQILDVVSGERATEPDVAAAFVSLADELALGSRYESVVFDHVNGGGRRRVVFDTAARRRLHMAARLPVRHQDDAVRGTLVEADFERSSARLRTPTGEAVSVAFPAELADSVEEALRRPAEFAGEVTYDPRTAFATSIRLRVVIGEPSLWGSLETEDFWRSQSLAELERSGALQAVQSADELRAPDTSEGEDLDVFFAAIAE
jgi:hypothetical protein